MELYPTLGDVRWVTLIITIEVSSSEERTGVSTPPYSLACASVTVPSKFSQKFLVGAYCGRHLGPLKPSFIRDRNLTMPKLPLVLVIFVS